MIIKPSMSYLIRENTMSNNTEAAAIMVVDDTPENLNLLRDMLQGKGYRVLAFPNGQSALNAAAKNPPDLILLDINMPEMNGFEVCKRLKANEKLKEIPILFISALTEIADKVHAFEAGGVDYVTKPFQFEEVHARVETHYNLRRMQKNLETSNQQLRELTEQKEQQRKTLEEELKLAGEMQKVLLKPAITGSDKVDFLVSYKPVSSLYCGGDYYDVIYLSRNRYLLLIGDVSGHGVRAALITGILKAIIYPEYIRGALGQELSPADFLSWLNKRMCFELRKTTGLFVTFLAGVLDLDSGTFRYANAGQNHPVLVRSNGCRKLAVSGAGLGVMASISYTEEIIDIAPGDVLNLFTDGLSELDGPEGKKVLDPSSIFESINGTMDYHKQILHRALNESGASRFTDDVTLLSALIR
jgi:DNA-binding response OmpR family regulator